MKFVGVPPQHFLVLFAVTWCLAVGYVGVLIAALARIKRLESPGEPFGLREICSPSTSLEALGVLTGARHKPLNDPLTTRLVWAARVMFCITLPLILYVFWQAADLAETL